MDTQDGHLRRSLLVGVGGLLVGTSLAGCTENSSSDDDGSETPTASADDSETPTASADDSETPTSENGDTETPTATDGDTNTATPAATETDGSPGSDIDSLDEREANVVDVAVERQNGDITFDVTLFHDDNGEDGYANWWQVERLDGTQLGRRDLLHAHSQQPFTRSDTIAVPEDVTCVVVRGHDQTHEYGGQAMLVDLDSGALRGVDQGADKNSFDSSDCP